MNTNEIKLRIAAIRKEQATISTTGQAALRLEAERVALENRLKNEQNRAWKQRLNAPIVALATQAVAAAQQKAQQQQQENVTRHEQAIRESARLAYTATNGSPVGFEESWPTIRQSMAVEAATQAAQQQISKPAEPEMRTLVREMLNKKYGRKA